MGLVADASQEAFATRPRHSEHPDHYETLLLSAISAREFSQLLEKKRIGISCDPEEWFCVALEMSKLRLVPLTSTLSH